MTRRRSWLMAAFVRRQALKNLSHHDLRLKCRRGRDTAGLPAATPHPIGGDKEMRNRAAVVVSLWHFRDADGCPPPEGAWPGLLLEQRLGDQRIGEAGD